MCPECSQNLTRYSLGCPYCCARILDDLTIWNLPPLELKRRRRENLKAWVDWGHDEQLIRDLHASRQFCAPQTQTKPRLVKRKSST